MKTWKMISRVSATLALTGFLSACGAQAYREPSSTDYAGTSGNSSTGTGSGSSSGSTTGSSTGSGSGSSTGSGLAAPITYDIQMKGTTAATQTDGSAIPTATTDDVFKVTVNLGQGANIPGTGFTANYRCARLTVTSMGQSQTAFVSNTGSDITTANGYSSSDTCFGAVSGQTLDFSGRLAPGHGDVSVSITAGAYDNCRLYGDVYSTGCPLTVPYWNHIITASISMHVNGTE